MRTLLDERDLEAVCARVASLTSASSARWGRLNVGGMLSHLGESMKMALGELKVRPKHKQAFQTFPLKHLILYVFPFPKGAPTAPELLAMPPGAIEDDKAKLQALLRRIGTGPREGQGPVHPLFGPLTRKEWGALSYKHADHHLRQFGA